MTSATAKHVTTPKVASPSRTTDHALEGDVNKFDLRTLIREKLASTDEADPGVIAGQVIAAIPKSQYGAALTQVMRLFVRQVISENRGRGRASNVTPLRRSPGKSWKGQGIRDGWQLRLNDPLHVGHAQWKLLRNCTYDDLTVIADERQQKADQNARVARMYRSYATAVSEAGVETFGDLPTEQLMHLLGSAA